MNKVEVTIVVSGENDPQQRYKLSRLTKTVLSNPMNPTASASYLLQITKTWDRGSRAVRENILREFVHSNENKTGPQLEREFSNGASLFLTRVSAWLRLTYLLGYNLSLQLKAINVFVGASSGNRFLTEFLEVGGVLTVLEILTLQQASEDDKAEGLRLLLSVSSNGRKYKEFICESYGVRQVTECLSKSRSEVTQDYARNLLYQLGTGNPKFTMQVFKGLQSLLTSQAVSPTAQQMAGQALRMLLPSIPMVPPGFIDPTMSLLKSPHIQVQYEGYEILKELMKRTNLQDPIILQLISILRNVVEEGADDATEDRHRRAKMDTKNINIGQWSGMTAEDQKEKELIASAYVQQAYAAKLLGTLAAANPVVAEQMIQFQLVSGLLNVIANTSHPDSQRYASHLLLFIVDSFDYVAYALREHMGANFFELLEHRPDTFYRELTKEQVRYLRRNTVKIKKEDSQPSLDDSESGSESSEDESKPDTPSKSNAFPSTKQESAPITLPRPESKQPDEPVQDSAEDLRQQQQQQAAIMENYERQELESREKPPVEDVYKPYVQMALKSTFSGNKYVVATAHNDGSAKFTADLNKFKDTILKDKKREGKKEFDVQNDPGIQGKIQKLKTDPRLFNKDTAQIGDGPDRERTPSAKHHRKKRGFKSSPSGKVLATEESGNDLQAMADPEMAGLEPEPQEVIETEVTPSTSADQSNSKEEEGDDDEYDDTDSAQNTSSQSQTQSESIVTGSNQTSDNSNGSAQAAVPPEIIKSPSADLLATDLSDGSSN